MKRKPNLQKSQGGKGRPKNRPIIARHLHELVRRAYLWGVMDAHAENGNTAADAFEQRFGFSLR